MKNEEQEIAEALEKINLMENEEKILETRKKQINSYLKEGDQVYELFSVTVHQGGAFGGHYYVYIKSFEDLKWYKFNDSSVTMASERDVVNTFGDSQTAKCAYLLMYRKVGTLPPPITPECIPEYLRQIIEQEIIQEIETEARLKEQRQKLTIKMHYGSTIIPIPMKKTETLEKLKQTVIY